MSLSLARSRSVDWNERIRSRLAVGLVRKSLTSPSRWAEQRIKLGPPLPGPWTFDYHPWLREPMDARCDNVVTLKGAQLGFTTAAIGRVLFMLEAERKSVLYLLPTQRPDATEFSATKLADIISESDDILSMFTETANVGLKRAGSASLFIRGANSRNALKSISVACIIFDEYDEMPAENIPLAEERMSGQFESEIWRLSTPTIPGMGVDADFQTTTKEYFYFPCPHGCKHTGYNDSTIKPRMIKLNPDDLVVTAEELTDPNISNSYVKTNCCNKEIPHEQKRFALAQGRYIAEGHKDVSNRGFAVNQLYSSQLHPKKIAQLKLRSLINPAAEQEFWNSKMGIAHETKGARLTDQIIDAAPQSDFETTQWTTMGVDVGSYMHIIIRNFRIEKLSQDLNVYCHSKLLLETKIEDPRQLDTLMRDYRVYMCVIDAQPERRLAVAFARRFPGHVRTCYYNTGQKGNTLSDHGEGNGNDADWRISADRTFWLDTTLGAFKSKRVHIHQPLSIENRSHLKALVRVYREARNEEKEPEAYYKNTGPDHYAHAWNYSEMALPLAVAEGTNQDITAFL